MPEGPEVRRYATQLAAALENQPILSVSARTKGAKAFLLEQGDALEGRRVETIRSHGKHLYGVFEGGTGFHSHLMMWGRWILHPGTELVEVDRRERARITTASAIALLWSAPIFEMFQGDPYEQIENLATLGPDVLPYDGPFDAAQWKARLQLPENEEREIGAVLLDQRVNAGIGNYLRADMLFFCSIDPWKKIAELTGEEIECLAADMPRVAARAYAEKGVSVTAEMRERLLNDPALSYGNEIREYGARHAVFRRTNLPCLVCGGPIKQKQQVVYRTLDGDLENEPENEKARTIYFCPQCQGVDMERFMKPKTKRVKKTVVAVETV
jgi:formamidopyrimidine-DNA glycosylase